MAACFNLQVTLGKRIAQMRRSRARESGRIIINAAAFSIYSELGLKLILTQ